MWYDIGVLGILVYSMARGASRGLVWQFATIAGIVLCLMFAETFSGIVGPHITLAPPYNEWVTMFGAYLFFSMVAFGAARFLTKSIENVGMKEYNAHLGALFGLIKGAIVCLVVTFFVATFPAAHDVIRTSKSGYYAALTMQKLHPIMPEKLHDALNKYIHSLDDVPGIVPLPENHVVDPNIGLADAVKGAQDALKDRIGNPLASSPKSGPPTTPANPYWGNQPSTYTYPTTPQSQQPGPGGSIPYGAQGPWGNPYNQPQTNPQYGVQYPPANQPNPVPNYGTPYPNYQQPQYQPSSYQQPAPAASNQSNDFWSQVRGAFGTQARQALAETLQSMDPATQQKLQKQILESLQQTRQEDLPQFERLLMQTGSTMLPDLLANWNRSSPAQPPQVTQSTNDREQLLINVTQLRSNYPQIQQRLQAELRGLMSGVPDNVAVAVLRDWKADLEANLSNNRSADPDLTTDANTPIEQRILTQMQRSGIRQDQLDPALRDRLSSGANAGAILR